MSKHYAQNSSKAIDFRPNHVGPRLLPCTVIVGDPSHVCSGVWPVDLRFKSGGIWHHIEGQIYFSRQLYCSGTISGEEHRMNFHTQVESIESALCAVSRSDQLCAPDLAAFHLARAFSRGWSVAPFQLVTRVQSSSPSPAPARRTSLRGTANLISLSLSSRPIRFWYSESRVPNQSALATQQ